MRFLVPLLVLACAACAQGPNTLTPEEKAAGWRLLFNGTDTAGWHAIGGSGVPDDWVAVDGELRLVRKDGKTLNRDIVTDEQFGDFELTWEWKMAPGANSGLKYNLPDPQKPIGCEYQMLDDDRHPDALVRNGEHRTASLYDVIPPPPNRIYHPAGEWNQGRILVSGNHVEQYLNGGLTVQFEFGSDELKALIAKSKFKSVPGWGIKTVSPLLLQDHGDEVSVRNIKIRVPAK